MLQYIIFFPGKTIFADGKRLAEKRISDMEENKYATDCGAERHKHIKGITCDVKSCVYHSGQSECYAGEICVGPSTAKCSANTVCATFKPKAY
jgi:hypothetical protein